VHFQGTLARYRGVCKTCGYVATVRFSSAMAAQLTIPGHDYSGDMTRQDGTTTLTIFSTAGDETEQLHAADVVQDIISYFWPLGPYMLYIVSTTSGPPVRPRFHCNYPPLSYKRTVQAVHLRGVNSTQTLCDVPPLSKDDQS
jgi:hypothetical protein